MPKKDNTQQRCSQITFRKHFQRSILTQKVEVSRRNKAAIPFQPELRHFALIAEDQESGRCLRFLQKPHVFGDDRELRRREALPLHQCEVLGVANDAAILNLLVRFDTRRLK